MGEGNPQIEETAMKGYERDADMMNKPRSLATNGPPKKLTGIKLKVPTIKESSQKGALNSLRYRLPTPNRSSKERLRMDEHTDQLEHEASETSGRDIFRSPRWPSTPLSFQKRKEPISAQNVERTLRAEIVESLVREITPVLKDEVQKMYRAELEKIRNLIVQEADMIRVLLQEDMQNMNKLLEEGHQKRIQELRELHNTGRVEEQTDRQVAIQGQRSPYHSLNGRGDIVDLVSSPEPRERKRLKAEVRTPATTSGLMLRLNNTRPRNMLHGDPRELEEPPVKMETNRAREQPPIAIDQLNANAEHGVRFPPKLPLAAFCAKPALSDDQKECHDLIFNWLRQIKSGCIVCNVLGFPPMAGPNNALFPKDFGNCKGHIGVLPDLNFAGFLRWKGDRDAGQGLQLPAGSCCFMCGCPWYFCNPQGNQASTRARPCVLKDAVFPLLWMVENIPELLNHVFPELEQERASGRGQPESSQRSSQKYRELIARPVIFHSMPTFYGWVVVSKVKSLINSA